MNFFGKFSTVISERRTNAARFSIDEIVNGVKEKFSSVGSRFSPINSSVNNTHVLQENIVGQVESDLDISSKSDAYHASLKSGSSIEESVHFYDSPFKESETENLEYNVKPYENSSVPPGSYVTADENRSRVIIDKSSAYYQNGDVISHQNTRLTSAVKECNSVTNKSEVRRGNYQVNNYSRVQKRATSEKKQHSTLHNYNDVPVLTQGHVARASRQARNGRKHDITVRKGEQKVQFTKTAPVKSQHKHPPRVRQANYYNYKYRRTTPISNDTAWNQPQPSNHDRKELAPCQHARRTPPWDGIKNKRLNKAYRAQQNMGDHFYSQYSRPPVEINNYYSQPGFNKKRGNRKNSVNHRNFRQNQGSHFSRSRNRHYQEKLQRPVIKSTTYQGSTYNTGRRLNQNSQQSHWQQQKSRNLNSGRINVHMAGLRLCPHSLRKPTSNFQHQKPYSYRRQNPQSMIREASGQNPWADFEAFWKHKPQNQSTTTNVSKPGKRFVTGSHIGASAVQCSQPIFLGEREKNLVKGPSKTMAIYATNLNRTGELNLSDNSLRHNSDQKNSDDKSPDNTTPMADLKLNNSAITSSLHKTNLQLIFNILTAVNIGIIIRLCYSRQGKIDCYRDEKGIMKAFSDRFHKIISA